MATKGVVAKKAAVKKLPASKKKATSKKASPDTVKPAKKQPGLELGDFEKIYPLEDAEYNFDRLHGEPANWGEAIEVLKKSIEPVWRGRYDYLQLITKEVQSINHDADYNLEKRENQAPMIVLMLSCYLGDAKPLEDFFLKNSDDSEVRVIKAAALGKLLLWMDIAYDITTGWSGRDFINGVERLKPSKPGDVFLFLMHAYVHANPDNFHERAKTAFVLTAIEDEEMLLKRIAIERALHSAEAWGKTKNVLANVIFTFMLKLLKDKRIQDDLKAYYQFHMKGLQIEDITSQYHKCTSYLSRNTSGIFRPTLMHIGVADRIHHFDIF